ncbi:MAG TPA: MFS transporter [Pyrinomonadaceae bacterium]|jgi:MFS family permease
MTTAQVNLPAEAARARARGMGIFKLINLGQFISMTGTGLTRFALGVWVYQRSGSATQFALVSLFAVLPNILVGPFAGALVDRWNRRRLLIACDTGAALSTLLLALLIYAGRLELWHVYLATGLSAGFGAFQGPAFSATVPLLVAKQDLPRAGSLAQLSAGVAQIVSPALAGLFITLIDLHGVLFIDFVTFLFAVTTLFVVPIPSPRRADEGAAAQRKSLLREAARGWSYLRERRGLLGMVVLFGVTNFFMGVVLALATPLILSRFRPAALGTAMTVSGLGLLAGGLLTARLGGPGRRALRVLAFTALAGVSITAAGLRASLPLIAGAAFVFFFAMQVVGACFRIIVQTKVEPGIQGRVFSLSGLIANSTLPLAYFTAGPLADKVFEPLMAAGGPLAGSVGAVIGTGPGRGIGLLFVLMGALTVVAVGCGWLYPRLRLLDLELADAIPDLPTTADAGREAPPSAADATPPVVTPASVAQPGADAGAVKRVGASAWAALTLAALLGLALLHALNALAPPAAVGEGAPPTDFSAARARAHLGRIAQRPHPVGAPAHEEVRDYLVGQLSALGLAPQVERTSGVLRRNGAQFVAGDVENILARLPGAVGAKTVVFAAHYDSAPTGPGASDDGAAVAALLETARAVKAGPPLKNDLLLLFTDAEEAGMLGAQAFVERHGATAADSVVINFEARGTSGPSLMFETSDGNRHLVREFARAARYPLASSVFQEGYKLLTNRTDFTVFREAGFAGMNFAYIDDPVGYHSERDSLASLDERSLQHHGDNALDLARGLGNADAPKGGGDAVYFTGPGGGLVSYAEGWALPLAGLGLLAFAAVVWLARRKGRLTWGGVGLGLAALPLSGALAAASVALFWWVVRAARVTDATVTWSDAYNLRLYVLGFALQSVALASLVYGRLGRRANAYELTLGGLLWWVLLGLATGVAFKGASYLFVWPLLFASAGLAAALLTSTDAADSRAPRRLLVASSLGALPGLLLLAPLVYLLFVGLSLVWSWAVVLLYALMLSLLAPHLSLLGLRAGRAVQACAAAGGVGLVLWCCLVSGYGATRPAPDSIFYGLNADTGKAVWASTDEYADDWTAQFLGADAAHAALPDFFPASSFQFLQAPAPAAPFEPPRAELLEDSTRDGRRTLRVRVSSARGAPLLQLGVERGDWLQAASLGGRPLEPIGDARVTAKWLVVQYWGLKEGGAELTLVGRPGATVTLRAVDQSYGLAPLSDRPYAARGPGVMPAQFGFGLTDATLVSKTFTY